MSGTSREQPFLIPEPSLRQHEAAVRAATAEAMAVHASLADDPTSEAALRYHLVFSDPTRARAAGFDGLDEIKMFYNQYFWFKRFVCHRTQRTGPDSGLEQQAFQLLEQAPEDIDWSVVAELDAAAQAN